MFYLMDVPQVLTTIVIELLRLTGSTSWRTERVKMEALSNYW